MQKQDCRLLQIRYNTESKIKALIILCTMMTVHIMRGLFLIFLVAHQTVEIDASQHHHLHLSANEFHRVRLFANSKAPQQHYAFLSMRGGASESASAWSAGSKYDYRTGPSSPNTRNYTPSYTQGEDEKDATKEVFAEAFLKREDRNRFIGEHVFSFVDQIISLSHHDIVIWMGSVF